MNKPSWYIVVIVAIVTVLCFVLYALVPAISVTNHVDTSLFHDAALIGFGALVGLITVKGVND